MYLTFYINKIELNFVKNRRYVNSQSKSKMVKINNDRFGVGWLKYIYLTWNSVIQQITLGFKINWNFYFSSSIINNYRSVYKNNFIRIRYIFFFYRQIFNIFDFISKLKIELFLDGSVLRHECTSRRHALRYISRVCYRVPMSLFWFSLHYMQNRVETIVRRWIAIRGEERSRGREI